MPVLLEERVPQRPDHGCPVDRGGAETPHRGPGVAKGLAALRHSDKRHDHLVAGARWIEAVLVIGQVQVPVVDDGQVEVVGEHLAEGDHPVDDRRRRAGWIGRVADLSACPAPAFAQPGAAVRVAELFAEPRGHPLMEDTRRVIVELHVRAVGRHVTGERWSLDLEPTVAGSRGRADAEPHPGTRALRVVADRRRDGVGRRAVVRWRIHEEQRVAVVDPAPDHSRVGHRAEDGAARRGKSTWTSPRGDSAPQEHRVGAAQGARPGAALRSLGGFSFESLEGGARRPREPVGGHRHTEAVLQPTQTAQREGRCSTPGLREGTRSGCCRPPRQCDLGAPTGHCKGPRKNNFPLWTADASRLAALLVGRILPVCSLLAPGQPSASTPQSGNLFLRGP